MTSDAQRKRGWTIPEVIETDERVCVQFEIPNTPEYRQATYGTISRLQEWFNWEKTWDEGDTRASQVAHYMRQILFNTLTMTDENCGVTTMFMLRQNPSDSCELQQSLDGGQTWSTAFDFSLCDIGGAGVTNINISVAQTYIQDLRTIYDVDINLIGAKLGNNDDYTNTALCHALGVLISGAIAGGLSRLQNGNNQELVIQAVAGVGAIAGAFIFGTPLAGGATAIGVGVGLIASAVMNGIEEQELEDLLNDQTALDALRCCGYDAIVNTKPTEASFATMFDNCSALPSNAIPGLTILQEIVTDLDVFLTFLESANQAYDYAENGVLGNSCDLCEDNCEDFEDLSNVQILIGYHDLLEGRPAPSIHSDENVNSAVFPIDGSGSTSGVATAVRIDFPEPKGLSKISYSYWGIHNKGDQKIGLFHRAYNSSDVQLAEHGYVSDTGADGEWHTYNREYVIGLENVAYVIAYVFRMSDPPVSGTMLIDNVCWEA